MAHSFKIPDPQVPGMEPSLNRIHFDSQLEQELRNIVGQTRASITASQKIALREVLAVKVAMAELRRACASYDPETRLVALNYFLNFTHEPKRRA